jgi:hypothetical protein
MITCLKRGSKVFEFLEGGAAARKAGRRKLNVFATVGDFIGADCSNFRMNVLCILDTAPGSRPELSRVN